MSKNSTKNYQLFPNEEAFQEIYMDCLERKPQAPEAVTSSYSGMCDMFEEYLCAVEEDMFRHAYQCGYEAAMAGMKKGGVA